MIEATRIAICLSCLVFLAKFVSGESSRRRDLASNAEDCFLVDFDYWGGDIDSVRLHSTRDASDCHYICEQTPGCEYFSYITENFKSGAIHRMCYLKSSEAGNSLKPTKGIITGPRVCVTSGPTKSPSRKPTQAPSKKPTLNPSRSPSKRPTSEPTVSPTKKPTLNPSKAPTRRPTDAPTKRPSDAPTRKPTKQPTKTPTTKSPTFAPSKGPTNGPTLEPSKSPSRMPTRLPSISPTNKPTKFPTVGPSKSPSKLPTGVPTRSPVPTNEPTNLPTQAPSEFNDLKGVVNQGLTETGGFCEGEFREFPEGGGVTIVGYLLATLGIVVGAVGIGLVVAHRSMPVYELSQRLFLCLFCAGVIFSNLALFPRLAAVSSPSKELCGVQAALLYISLTFLVSCICARSWKEWISHELEKNRRTTKVRNRVLFSYIMVSVVIMVILVSVVVGVADFAPDPCDGFRCSSSSWVASYVAFCYLIVLSLLAIVLSFITRNLRSIGNELRYMFIASNVGFLCIVMVGIVFAAQPTDIAVEAVLVCLAVFIFSVVTVSLFVFRKDILIGLTVDQLYDQFFTKTSSKDNKSSGGSDGGGSHPYEYSYSTDASRVPHYSFQQPQDYMESTNNSTAPALRVHMDRYRNVSESDLMFNPESDIIVKNLDTNEQNFSDGLHIKTEPPAASASNDGEPNEQGKNDAELDKKRREGFKVGQEGEWEEYVHRQTGESFWLNAETGQVSKEKPNEPVMVSTI